MKKINNTTTLLVVLVLIALTGLGFGLFFGFRNFSKEVFNGVVNVTDSHNRKACEEACIYPGRLINGMICEDPKRNVCYPYPYDG